ncbi:hypothetical protein [Demequina sp.]|uniref:hypothetical protein n=1 Tax=Demequina sp. TaxID=2050685 RepID=UPI0025C4B015|nr:hypothetical protein [Demequina sp.]
MTTKIAEPEAPTTTPLVASTTTFVDALRAVFPHASRDKTLPILTGVNMVGDTLVATDRYTMGAARFDLDDLFTVVPEGDVWLSPEFIRLVLGRKGDPLVSLGASDESLCATFESGVVYGVPVAGRLDVGHVADYPNVGRFVAEWQPVRADAIAFNPAFSSRFSNLHFPAGTGGAPLVYEPGKSRTAQEGAHNQFRVTRGGIDWFVGIVVEIRVPS